MAQHSRRRMVDVLNNANRVIEDYSQEEKKEDSGAAAVELPFVHNKKPAKKRNDKSVALSLDAENMFEPVLSVVNEDEDISTLDYVDTMHTRGDDKAVEDENDDEEKENDYS